METFLAKHGWAVRAAGICLFASLRLLAHDCSGSSNPDSACASVRPSQSLGVSVAPASQAGDPFRVRTYLLDFAGDYSLSGATVTEEAAGGHANYTVNLRLASGVEQSVIVAGPPGGLQIEMQDMTGDHVPNDVVLRPAWFSWLPTVLVNDGHDHFAVVVSGANPGNFSSPEDLGSRRRNTQTFVFLRSSGFRAIDLCCSKRMLVPQLQHRILSPFAQCFASGIEHASPTDRAPPFVASI